MVRQPSFTFACVAALAAGVLAGCGGGSSSSSTTSGTAAPVTSASAMATSGGQSAAMAQAAPIPASLTCKDAIVWANTKRHNYHMAGDPYYGRTKNGQYMCQADAVAAGYHAAGMRQSHMSSATPSDMATAGATP